MKITSRWLRAAGSAGVIEIVFARPELSHGQKCCSDLATSPSLKNRVIFPNSTIYEDRVESIWSLDAALSPWCIVLPESTGETAVAIKIINANECPFGIRSGGHGLFPNSNNIQDGVTIDFGYMNSTTYDLGTNTASLQPGGRWGSVYKALEPYGVSVAGGRQNPVGVAGFLLGGGNSYYNNAYGWGCDTIKNFEVVLADGRVVNANEAEHRNLWIALKGGTGNFGLVTRFDMEAIAYADPFNPVFWGGTLSWGKNMSDSVIDVLVEFADNAPNDIRSTSHCLIPYLSTGGWTIICVLVNMDNKPTEPAFDGWKSIPSRLGSTLRHDTMWSLAEEASGPGGAHNFNIPCAVRNDPRILKYIFDRHEELVQQVTETIPSGAVWYSLLQFQPITVPMVANGKGLNSLGLENEIAEGAGIVSSITMQMTTPELESIMYTLALECQADIEAYAASIDGLWEWRYLNYADHTYDPIASYGRESVKRLREVSRQYDPKGVFQSLRKSGFKIPK